jgi:hypothetical protein
MSHLQNYADQMGGFDFTLTQRYGSAELETSFSRKRRPSSRCLTKRLELLSSASSSQKEWCWLPIRGQLEDPSSSKRTARRFTISLPTSTRAGQALLQTPSSSTSSCPPTSNCNASTPAGRPESAPTSPPLPVFSTGTRAISEPISSWAATTSWAAIW